MGGSNQNNSLFWFFLMKGFLDRHTTIRANVGFLESLPEHPALPQG
jgi:hypothetical protein